MNITAYQLRAYGPQPCWELVADILANEAGIIGVAYTRANRSVRAMADAFRIAIHDNKTRFIRVDEPADFDVVLMGKNSMIGIHHCGIWYEGKILHAEPGLTMYEDRSSLQCRFNVMEFWRHAH